MIRAFNVAISFVFLNLKTCNLNACKNQVFTLCILCADVAHSACLLKRADYPQSTISIVMSCLLPLCLVLLSTRPVVPYIESQLAASGGTARPSQTLSSSCNWYITICFVWSEEIITPTYFDVDIKFLSFTIVWFYS